MVKTRVCVLVPLEKTRTQLAKSGVCVLVPREKTRTQLVKSRVCVLVPCEKTRTQLAKLGDCVLVHTPGRVFCAKNPAPGRAGCVFHQLRLTFRRLSSIPDRM